jgi:hypothetical protein
MRHESCAVDSSQQLLVFTDHDCPISSQDQSLGCDVIIRVQVHEDNRRLKSELAAARKLLKDRLGTY